MSDARERADHWDDDPSIHDDDGLLRRIVAHAGWFSAKDGTLAPPAFLDRTSPLGLVSVHRENLTTHAEIKTRYGPTGLARLIARVPRENEHNVAADPTTTDVSHAVLAPRATLGSNQKRKEAARRIAKAATIIVPVPEPE